MVRARRADSKARSNKFAPGPILVFIDRGGRFETNTDGTRSSTSVHSPTIRLTTLGGQYRRHPYRLETLSALVLNDHAYDKLTGWSNVIPVVPVKRRRDRDL